MSLNRCTFLLLTAVLLQLVGSAAADPTGSAAGAQATEAEEGSAAAVNVRGGVMDPDRQQMLAGVFPAPSP